MTSKIIRKKIRELSKIKQKIIPILKNNKIKKAGIFGSYARGEQKKNSDIDILIEISKKVSLLELLKIKIILEKELNKKVDLIEYDYIHPLIKQNALDEEIRIQSEKLRIKWHQK